MNLEKSVAYLIQKVERRFYGKYRGLVVDNADPEQLGRLKLTVPSVLGPDVVTGWALPCTPYGGDLGQGMLFVPEVGAGVWIEFEEGDLEFPVWVGTFWSKPDGESELPKPNDPDGAEQGSVQDPPTRKIIKTKAGHTIQFEDAEGEEMIILYEAEHEHVVVLNQDGITITDGQNGSEIVLDSAGVTISDGPNSPNQIAMESGGITIEDKNGNTISMGSSGPMGPSVAVGGSKRICTEDLITWLLSHQHVGNMGAPTPLFPGSMGELLAAQGGANTILSKKLTTG